jgi:1-acyl-sn-glycerol-3-phosphate acyltransferase
MRTLQAVVRLLGVLQWVLRGWWRVRVARGFAQSAPHVQAQAVEVWARGMLRIMGIEVRIEGTPATGPVLMAANHISWLDILVMHAARHCRFVAKSDIRHWPLVGALTTAGQSLYIERASSRDALRVVHHMHAALLQGDVLGVFPEASTGRGDELLPFHGNLLQAAIAADAPIQPVGLRFVEADTGQPSFAPCYINDDTLVGSLWRTLTAPPLLALVRYGEPQRAQGRSRRDWAHDLRETIGQLLK